VNGHEKSGNGCISVIPELENHNHFKQRSMHEKKIISTESVVSPIEDIVVSDIAFPL